MHLSRKVFETLELWSTLIGDFRARHSAALPLLYLQLYAGCQGKACKRLPRLGVVGQFDAGVR
jgi:hypothetical protein